MLPIMASLGDEFFFIFKHAPFLNSAAFRKAFGPYYGGLKSKVNELMVGRKDVFAVEDNDPGEPVTQ